MTIPLDYHQPPRQIPPHLSKWGKGFLSVAGTLTLSGLGQLLAGRKRRAAGWFVASVLIACAAVAALLTPALQPALIGLLPTGVVFQIACLIDAFVVGRLSPRPMLGSPLRRYAAGVALVALSAFLQPTVRLTHSLLTPRTEGFAMPTKSTTPTLRPGDRFLVLKSPWQVRCWDLIAFHPPLDPAHAREVYTKRVAGLPGEKIEIVEGRVRVNDQPVNPPEPIGPYTHPRFFNISRPPNGVEGNPIVLAAGEYFVLGDNSPISAHSRMWIVGAPGHQPGAVPAESIVGRVTASYWPPSRWRRFVQQ